MDGEKEKGEKEDGGQVQVNIQQHILSGKWNVGLVLSSLPKGNPKVQWGRKGSALGCIL